MAHILVVDDVAASRSCLAEILAAKGHRVSQASDGRKAVDAVGAERPDLIITDVLMPVMDGYELVRRLRLDPANIDIPVLFYTAPYGEREARALAIAGGVPYVLTKPVDPDRVLRIVESVLAKDAAPEGKAAMSAPARHQLRLLGDDLPEESGGLRLANARLRAVINITLDLAAERGSEPVLQYLCGAARDLFGATYVTLGLVHRTDRTVQSLLCSGPACEAAYGANWLAVGDPVPGMLGDVVDSRCAIRGDNPGGAPASLQLPALHPEIRAFLAAPLASEGHVYGWFCLVGNEGRSFSDHDEQLLLALAGQVGHMYELEYEMGERRDAELALQLADERTRFALQAAGVGIWDFDPRSGAVLWSSELEVQHGVAPGTFAGTFDAFVAAVHPEDRDKVRAIVAAAFVSGEPYRIEYRVTWPDGGVRWLNGAGRIMHDASGRPDRGVGISLDVTERRALEVQSQQTQKMEAVGRLAGGVAHDFNNLLTAILGYCELLLDGLPPEDARRGDVEQIQNAGNSAADLTRQLLTFSRKEVMEHTLFDLNSLVADMRPMLGRLIGEDVAIAVTMAPTPAVLRADRCQMQQVVMNLVLNARDAMPSGGTLGIDIGREGDAVTLRVTDTGTGMTAGVRARLFEPFFTTKEPGRGTGLGLATVLGIVTQAGGTITVDSVAGRGTAFAVVLPGVDAAELSVPPAPPALPAPPRATQTILLVEDAEGLRALAERLLERQGYTVLSVASAPAALAIAARHAFIDVLLTDVVMPGGSGPELALALTARQPSLKVIYMSGYAEDAILRRGVFTGDVAFLHKPFSAAQLHQKIRDVLGPEPTAFLGIS